jgi:NTE family protein
MFEAVLQRTVFPNLKLGSPRTSNLQIVIGACELRTGSAFRFGNVKSGSWRLGELVDEHLDVSFAVAASAAYPIFLPAFDRKMTFRKNNMAQEARVLITDGGVYDNLGVQVLEPGRDPKVSLHSFPCDYIIACNAGHGQDSGDKIPVGFIPRVSRAFEIVHRRVQDSAMHRLHHLRQVGAIKGFALPYLGQQDHLLPSCPAGLIPRSEAIAYPTDFAPMPAKWIDKLSARGEQLTRLLAREYLPDLIPQTASEFAK